MLETSVPDEGFAVVTHYFSPKESELAGEKTVQTEQIGNCGMEFLSLPPLITSEVRRNPQSEQPELVDATVGLVLY